jgi:hypothetical protein
MLKSKLQKIYRHTKQRIVESVFFVDLKGFVFTAVNSYTRTRARKANGGSGPIRLVGSSLIAIAMIITLSLSLTQPTKTLAATSNTINFQARLTSNTGAIVPDGNYNIEFKLYNVSSAGAALWTEDYTWNSGSGATDIRVPVVNGYLSVALGSNTAFPAINWDQNLWLGMNIGGTAGSGTYPSMGDGEMTPRLALTAVPYAFKAGTLAVLTGVNTSTLNWTTQTAANALLLPNESGTVCTTAAGGACSALGFYIQNGTAIQTANFNIQSAAAGSIGGVIRGAVSQSADLQQWQNSAGGILDKFNSNGDLQIGGTATASSTTALQIQNAAGNQVFGVDTASNLALLGKASTVNGALAVYNSSNANTTTIASGITSANYTLTLPTAIGTTGQCLVINSVAGANAQLGYTACGTHTKKIVIPAEYSGVVLDPGTGANNTGTITSGIDLTNRENYYQWVTTQATSQSYDVDVQVPIPSDFSSWGATPISVDTYTTDTTNGTIKLEARDTSGVVETSCNFAAITPTATSTWQTKTCTIAGTYTASGYMTLRVRLYTTSAVTNVRIGNITLNYLSQY